MRNKIIKILENHQELLGVDIGVGASMYGVLADKIITDIVESACKERRLICSRAYLDEKGYEVTNSIMATVILNAPSPKESGGD